MKQLLPFDEKNSRDFIEVTQKISNALVAIESDQREPATKNNLARLSGVHRNTLRNRAIEGSADGDANKGWPFSVLNQIRQSRIDLPEKQHKEKTGKGTPEEAIHQLKSKLEKSRYVAGKWFHRTLELKRERDEARRQVQLILKQLNTEKSENNRLQKQLQKTMKVVKI